MATDPIRSRGNARAKQLRAAFDGNARLAGGLIALEGDHLVSEAVRSGLRLHTVFVREGRAEPAGLPRGVECVVLAADVFASAVATGSPQGIAALAEPPVSRVEDMLRGGTTPLLVIACGLQDPGNLGTLVRSAEAFGAGGVLLAEGTVSPWNAKTVRASAGSVLRMPLTPADEHALALLANAGVRLLAAVKDNAEAAHRCDLRAPVALLIGNEGAGLSDWWLRRATGRITIPCPGPVESLNAAVAGSLLLYEAARQREREAQ